IAGKQRNHAPQSGDMACAAIRAWRTCALGSGFLGHRAWGGFYCQAERGCVAGDQPRTAAISEPGPDPVEEDRHPAAKADQEKEVDDSLEHPCDRSSQLDPAEIVDCRLPADRGERALVAMVEWLGDGLY